MQSQTRYYINVHVHAALHTCTYIHVQCMYYIHKHLHVHVHEMYVHVESATDAKNAGLLAVLLTDMLKSETVQKHVATSTRLVSVQVPYTCTCMSVLVVLL